ncbi:MAG: hypothetical protein JO219_07680 [Candidatus Eremiobacteraeota bacterium]|nr:hypothetical protein [Candidatus Eremiobacteraeota bacterium]MBV8366524.1 hypothetical protein [Candidatus Eremiobacteraeota bacterium]
MGPYVYLLLVALAFAGLARKILWWPTAVALCLTAAVKIYLPSYPATFWITWLTIALLVYNAIWIFANRIQQDFPNIFNRRSRP